MKINFLNDESYKFDEQLDDSQDSIQPIQFDDSDPIIAQDIFQEQSDTFDDTDDEFPTTSVPPKQKTKEHDILIDESRTHRKFRLIALSAVIIFTAAYLSLDYIDFDKFFPESKEEKPKEYIETIIRDTSTSEVKNEQVSNKKPVKTETKQAEIKAATKTRSKISNSVLEKSSRRVNQVNTIEHISSFSFVSAKLQHIYLNNQTVFFEVFSETRKKLASFSKALNNQIRQIKLTESRNYNNNGYSAIYKYPSKNESSADYNLIQSANEVTSLTRQIARSNSIKLIETTIERGSNSNTPILIRATGSLADMNKFIQLINQSLNNVELSKFSLASTKQKENTQAKFLLSMRLIVLK